MATVKNDNKKNRSKSISLFRELGTTYKVLSYSFGGSPKGFEHTLEPNGLGAPIIKLTHKMNSLVF